VGAGVEEVAERRDGRDEHCLLASFVLATRGSWKEDDRLTSEEWIVRVRRMRRRRRELLLLLLLLLPRPTDRSMVHLVVAELCWGALDRVDGKRNCRTLEL
jgi:hypothetical protein